MIEIFAKERLIQCLADCYSRAEEETEDSLSASFTREEASAIKRCAVTRHAARGAALTLGLCKMVYPDQDIRLHKAEMTDGYSARRIDTAVTVPFLMAKGLPYNVETHWLSQTLSFAGSFMPDLQLKTVPKCAGLDLVKVANIIQASSSVKMAGNVVSLILLY